ncbi:MAG: hypothetical protein U0441_28630 [Polyangiaceae bacterium]
MRPRSLARSLALALAVTPGVALADPPAAPPTSAPSPASPPAATPAPAPAAAAKPPPLPAAGKGSVAAPTAKVAKAAAQSKGAHTKASKKHKKGAKDAPLTGAPIVTYPGFRMLDGGGSRVLVAMSKKANVTETKAAGKLTYRIQGVQVPTYNNQRPLVTTFFSTPVSRAELVPRDADVDLVIDAKDTAGVVFRVVETDKGAELQVDFPKVVTDPDEKAAASAASATPAAATTTEATKAPVAPKNLENKTDTAY